MRGKQKDREKRSGEEKRKNRKSKRSRERGQQKEWSRGGRVRSGPGARGPEWGVQGGAGGRKGAWTGGLAGPHPERGAAASGW